MAAKDTSGITPYTTIDNNSKEVSMSPYAQSQYLLIEVGFPIIIPALKPETI